MVPTIEHPAQRVVVAYDFSPPAEIAFMRALDLAVRAPWHVLHLVAAIDDDHPLRDPEDGVVDYRHAERIQELIRQKVSLACAARHAFGQVEYFVHARIGDAADEILGLAEQIGADLIMIGSHGYKGVERLLFGSVSEQVVRKAGCPVMVARPKLYKDVELTPVVDVPEDDPAHKPYRRPHRYSYDDGASALTRPNDWPIS